MIHISKKGLFKKYKTRKTLSLNDIKIIPPQLEKHLNTSSRRHKNDM